MVDSSSPETSQQQRATSLTLRQFLQFLAERASATSPHRSDGYSRPGGEDSPHPPVPQCDKMSHGQGAHFATASHPKNATPCGPSLFVLRPRGMVAKPFGNNSHPATTCRSAAKSGRPRDGRLSAWGGRSLTGGARRPRRKPRRDWLLTRSLVAAMNERDRDGFASKLRLHFRGVPRTDGFNVPVGEGEY